MKTGSIQSAPPPSCLAAAWVAPMLGPALRDAAVIIAGGRIVDVGPRPRILRDHPEALVKDLGSVILLPGLVNAHVHLELSDCAAEPVEIDRSTDGAIGEAVRGSAVGGDSPANAPANAATNANPAAGARASSPRPLGPWLMGIIRKTASSPPQDRITAAVARGVEQCVRFGVTCAGDISRQCALTRPLLREAPLRLNSYGEIQAMAARRGLLQERLDAALHAGGASATLRIGLSPHAPYTVEPAGFETCLALARERGIPLATHLAESAQEREFLEHHTGGFRDLWESIQSWDDRVPRFEGGPIRFAAALGLLEYPTLLAHVNYCDDAELALLAAGRASVVWCPRTHAYFRHPPHRWRDMLARGVNVAVGTDSCASSPDLNLVDDLRLMHRLSPRTPCQTLWEMATLRGARALQWGDVGAIAAGYHADLIAFDVETDDPLREILENHSLPGRVWFGGRE